MSLSVNSNVGSNVVMHSLYYASKKVNTGSKTEFTTSSKVIEESTQTNYTNKFNKSGAITNSVTQVSSWPSEDTLDPAFITYYSELTGFDTTEYFFDLSSDEDNPIMYMRTKTGEDENYYKLEMNSINPSSATKSEMLGYYSYKEYQGENVDMYQLMANMDMAEHNGYVGTGEDLKAGFLKYAANWVKGLQDVLTTQKKAGDYKGETATQSLLRFMNNI